MKIRIKFFLSSLIIIVIPLLFFSTNIFYTASWQVEESVRKDLSHVTDLKLGIINNYLVEMKKDITTSQDYFNIKKNLPIVSAPENSRNLSAYFEAKQMLDKQIATLKKEKNLSDVLLVDASGRVVYAVDPLQQTTLGKLTNEWIGNEYALNKSKSVVYFSEIFIQTEGVEKPEFKMLVTAPVYNDEKQFLGWVVFEVNMNPIYDTIQDTTGLGQTGETIIAKKIDDKILFLNPLRKDPNAALNRTVQVNDKLGQGVQNAVIPGARGEGIITDYVGDESLATWRYFELMDWGVLTKIDTSEAFAATGQLKQTITIALLFFGLVIILAGVLVTRFFTKPIEELHQATHALANGKFNTRVCVRTKDELGELGEAFNQSAEALGQLEEERKQIDKAKTEFLSITSHELRSPMTPMKAQLQMLLQNYFGRLNPEQKESLNLVLKNTERLDGAIQDLLEVSRIEAARLKFNFVRTNLVQDIKRTVKEMDGFMPEKRIRIKTKIGKLPVIEVDPNRVTQVLRNLLNNAIKFSLPGQEVLVTAEQKGSTILFSVKDQGIGISQEDQTRIFEPFFQAEKTMYRKYGGTGLGLIICKGIVEAQKGKIWFESKIGKGSTFYFTVPLKPVREAKQIILLFSKENIKEKTGAKV